MNNKLDSFRYELFTNPQKIERDFNVLIGIIEGIVCDKEINSDEKEYLENWINEMKFYIGKDPYDSILLTLEKSIEDNILTTEEKENIIWLCNKYINEKPYYNSITRDIQTLHGVVFGIIADNKIHEDEIYFLDQWLNNHEYLKNAYPYDELFTFLTLLLNDGEITATKKSELLVFLEAISGKNQDSEDLVNILNYGICQIDPQIVFENSVFCITGESLKYKRSQIASMICSKGGKFSSTVNKSTNYLIVCAEKNNNWAYKCYGRKIEESIILRKKGVNIAIVHEFDLLDLFVQ